MQWFAMADWAHFSDIVVPSVTCLSLALPASHCATPSAQVPLYPVLTLSFLQLQLSRCGKTRLFSSILLLLQPRERERQQQNLQTTVFNRDWEKRTEDYCISLAYATDWHSNWHQSTTTHTDRMNPDNASLWVTRACAGIISIYRHSFPHKDWIFKLGLGKMLNILDIYDYLIQS